MNKIYSINKYVNFYECNQDEELSLWGYLAWCSEISGQQLDNRSITRESMMAEKQVFLLSQVSCEFIKPAKYKDNCILKTWESTISGVKFIRSYSLENENGDTLCRSSSSWILVDPQSRRILRPKEYNHESLLLNDDVYPKLSRLKMPVCEKSAEHLVVYSELDGNHHLNNRHYGRILLDNAPAEFLCKALKSAEIQFINEARLNETISIYSSPIGETEYCVYGILPDGRKCFEATAKVKA